MPKLHILVVDDTPSNLTIAQAYLEPLQQHLKVSMATSGQEAIALALRQSFDLIFMDLEMPGLDGFDTSQSIRNQSSTPIIAMTGHTHEHIKQHPLSNNFNGFMGKPFNDADMILLINRHCLTTFKIATREPLSPPSTSTVHGSSQQTTNTINNSSEKNRITSTSNEPLLDLQGVLKRLNNNTKLLSRVLKSFSQNNHKTYAHFEQALTHKDWASAKRIAHTLKGGGANIGAKALSALGGELEKICLNQTQPSPQQMAALKTLLEQTICCAKYECNQIEAQLTPNKLASHTPAIYIKDGLKEVLSNININVAKAQDQLDDIEKKFPNDQAIQQMVALFNQFELEQLAEHISSYLNTH